ncbi:MAG: HAD-IC family P-type ATPase, partial [Rhodothermales bacterium]|nr:HAD-IC family P-type ATPase [Rhodothermales bacterium]
MTVATPIRLDASEEFDAGRTKGLVSDGAWWAIDGEDVAMALSADVRVGLSDAEVIDRRQLYGRNALEVRRRVQPIAVLVRQFQSVIVLLLGAALAVALLFGETLEAIAIGAVIVLNAAIGFFTELRAERSIEALLRLSAQGARVLREGRVKLVTAEELVPGDVLILEAGDVVTADVRLTESSKLESDESVLTGESLPTGKDPAPVSPDTPIHARSSMLFKGASVSRGSARGIVVAIGQGTELGKIAELSRTATPEATPLERRLDRLGRRLVGLTVLIGIGVTIAGVMSDKDLYLMVQTAVALAVATIPEGLPIVATIALAAGVRRMARRNVLINRLSSVETLGSTHVVCTDKTGTLTENRMNVAEIITAVGRFAAEDVRLSANDMDRFEADGVVALSMIAGLCSEAESGDESGGGEPMERAMYRWLDAAGIPPRVVRSRYPRVNVEAFDPDVKMMATIHEAGKDFIVMVKGAPEKVLEASPQAMGTAGSIEVTDEMRAEWLAHAEKMGLSGQRVLGTAFKRVSHGVSDRAFEGLHFVGLIGMFDPPRRDVSAAIRECDAAGIKVVMVTGDQPGTAASVAQSVGLEARGDT